MAQSALETFDGIRTVRAYSRDREEADRFRRFLRATIQRAQRGINAEALDWGADGIDLRMGGDLCDSHCRQLRVGMDAYYHTMAWNRCDDFD